MKKSKLTKVIAIVLALAMLSASFGAVTAGASNAFSAFSSSEPLKVIMADIIDTILRIATDFLASLFGNGPGFYETNNPKSNAELEEKIAANYYDGTGKDFQKEAAADAKWHLGYANASLIPEDYDNGTYYIGGYIAPENGFSNVVEGIAEIPGIGKDDMKVRCIAISDGSVKAGDTEKETVLFAVIDSIGVTNADIKDIRALLADYAKAHNIEAINVSSTHCHSGIDTQGLWTKNIAKLISNGVISGTQTEGELQQGTNPKYMAWMKERVAQALIKAHKDMKEGELSYVTKDLGQDYFQNKNRPTSGQITEFNEDGTINVSGKRKIAMTNIERFIFTPDDKASRPTMILNMAAHPDVAGLPTESNSGREISGDYVFYCGQYLDKAGYNFIFFQGAIAGIYMSRGVTGDNVETKQRVEESQRYGYEIARLALSLELTEEQAKNNPLTSDLAKEIAENTKEIPILDSNKKPVPEIATPGNNYTFVIDAQDRTVDIDESTKVIKISSRGKLLYELDYGSDAEIQFNEEFNAHVVVKDNSPLAIIVYGDGTRQIAAPNKYTIAITEKDGTTKAYPLGRSRIVTATDNRYVVNEDGTIFPYALDVNNNFTLVLDAQDMNVVYDGVDSPEDKTHSIEITKDVDGTQERVYFLNLKPTDVIVNPTPSTYIVADGLTGNIIAAFSTDANQKIDYSTAGKLILRDAQGTALGEIEIGKRKIVTANTKFKLLNVDGALTKCRVNPHYSVWYEDWNKTAYGEDNVPTAVPVDAFLNLYIKQVDVPISNTLITAIGKLNMANYVVKAHEDGTYSTVTEIGYMEMGKQFKAVFLPGEICQDLVALNGASLYKENAVTVKPFSDFVKDASKTTAAAIFSKDVKCFGVMNDAIGYVVPDNDYTMGDPANHYHELISLGQHVGSSLINGLIDLANEIK